MALVDVTMPKMGESITEGTVIAWHKKPGESVELDETLLEIGTDKVDTEVPSPTAGRLAEIFVEEGATVEVGTLIARVETDVNAALGSASPASGDGAAAAPAPPSPAAPAPAPVAETPIAQAPAPPAPAAPGSAAPAPASAGGTRVDVVMPKMGESITEGTVIAWHKKPGESVELDETLLEIGTDKVDTEVPAPVAGTLVEILVGEGETVEVGARIAVLAVGAGAAASVPTNSTSPELASPPVTPPDAPEAVAFQTTPAAEEAANANAVVETPPRVGATPDAAIPASDEPIGRTDAQGRFVSPLVRAIAEKEGLTRAELSTISGSGREGRVSKADVLRHIEQRTAQPATPAPATAPTARPSPAPAAPMGTPSVVGGERVEIIEMDRMRRIIADHMVRSKATSPHVTSFAEIDVTNLVRHREANKAAFERSHGVKLTYTPYFVHAAVEALRAHPLMNASVDGTRILVKKDFHVGIAVALGTTGLVAPVIRNAGEKNLIGLAKAAGDLATRARNKGLQPDELQGGTFTVTNIGSLGSLMGTPIINQPQVAIIAVGAIKKRPVVLEDPVLGDVIAIRSMMYVSLSYDHRIIDGAMAASFLQKYVATLEATDPNAGV